MALIVVAAGSYLGYRESAGDGCAGGTTLNVAAAPEVAPAVQQAADRWVAAGAEAGGSCVRVSVTKEFPAAMAAVVARQFQASLPGLGAATGSVAVPDVWIADSRTWLLRIQKETPAFAPGDGSPIARSPIVVAMPAPVAERFGWPGRKLGWNDLLAEMRRSSTIRTGIVDPNRDASGLSGLLALTASADAGPEGQAEKAGALRALVQDSSALRDDLVQKFPRASDPRSLSSALSAAPLSEEDVLAYNAGGPPVPLAAVFLDPAPPGLDYPYAIMPKLSPQKSAAAAALRKELNAADFKNFLAKAGLRAADGTVGEGFRMPDGAPEPTRVPTTAPTGGTAGASLDAGAISQALGSWAAVTQPGRTLVLFDASESMGQAVPSAGNRSRAEVTEDAARQGLALFDARWSVGVWLFASELDGDRPWREVMPIKSLGGARDELQEATKRIKPVSGGGTGLHESAVAAYKEVQEEYQQGLVNSVLIITDGGDGASASAKEDLIAELRSSVDPKRPVRMVIVGVGGQVDRGELDRLAGVAPGGAVFLAPDPAKLTSVFLEAISSR